MLTQKAQYHTAIDRGPLLAHHFDDMKQQQASAIFGMWLFLVTEIMFFGGMFAAYIVYRGMHHEAFVAGSHTLDVVLGTLNTFVLLTSSFTMARAVHAGHESNSKQQVRFMLVTLVLGMVFLGIKGYEYYTKYEHHHMPLFGLPFEPGHEGGEHGEGLVERPTDEWHAREVAPLVKRAEAEAANRDFAGTRPLDERQIAGQRIFFSLYFAMTGVHAIHMVIGATALIILMLIARTGAYNHTYYTPLELMGLYWHFVDIVWIFLFPLLYLIDRTQV
jgi:cytochrome c oxidase subunit 3